jgi:hypothetical protein
MHAIEFSGHVHVTLGTVAAHASITVAEKVLVALGLHSAADGGAEQLMTGAEAVMESV